jgi:hypothetical protein
VCLTPVQGVLTNVELNDKFVSNSELGKVTGPRP